MKSDLFLYYIIAASFFLIITLLIQKKVMRNYIETKTVKNNTRIAIGMILVFSILLGIRISQYFFLIPLLMGTGLIYYGFTGFCMLSIIISKVPWSKIQVSCTECEI